MVKFAEVAPLATVTVAGTVAAASLSLDRVTVRCAAVPAAGESRVTVPVEFVAPPGTLAGFRVTDTTCGSGATVSVALCVPPFSVALMLEVVVTPTTWLVTVKLAAVAPAATVTLAGTVAAAVLLLERLTVRCAAVPTAGAFKVTVAAEFFAPPGTLVGFNVTCETVGWLTVRTKCCTAFDPTPLLAVKVML